MHHALRDAFMIEVENLFSEMQIFQQSRAAGAIAQGVLIVADGDALLYRVELTASFLERLDAIEAFLVAADAGFAFDDLLAELRATVIPNLRRFPRIGRRYLANPPQSAEALAQLAALPAGAPDALREYLHGDYLMLYTVVDASPQANACVYLLSIRHHRQLSFDFAKLWPNGGE